MTEESKEEQEVMFEAELRKSQCDESFSDNSDAENDEICKTCQKLMSRMRKTAVRWLYLEWYKKAVLGLSLPTVRDYFITLYF